LNAFEIAGLLLAAGVGGAVGAASTVLLAGANTLTSFEAFEAELRSFMANRTDPPSRQVMAAFETFKAAYAGLSGAIARLKRALRIR